MHPKILKLVLILFIFFQIFTACKTTEGKHNKENENQIMPLPPDSLSLVFAGDVMSHTENFTTSDFNKIWDSIRDDVSACDLAFCNLEAPVNENLPFESYPTFNMKHSYPQAAIDCGFNVISLSNNHTNDKGIAGIAGTREWASSVMEKTAESSRPVYMAGLKEDGQFSYSVIKKNGFTILYTAMTEILNSMTGHSEINYVPATKKDRSHFVEYAKKLRENHPCDIFVVSIHTNEKEYVLTVEQNVKEFYYELLHSGVDVITSNHPHVIRPVELFGSMESGKIIKAIMYANGNTISGQRRIMNMEHPEDIRQYTGDGLLVYLTFTRDFLSEKIYISNSRTEFITTYVDEENDWIIKKLDDNFIRKLEEQGKNGKAEFFLQRKKLLEQIKGNTIWE